MQLNPNGTHHRCRSDPRHLHPQECHGEAGLPDDHLICAHTAAPELWTRTQHGQRDHLERAMLGSSSASALVSDDCLQAHWSVRDLDVSGRHRDIIGTSSGHHHDHYAHTARARAEGSPGARGCLGALIFNSEGLRAHTSVRDLHVSERQQNQARWCCC